MSNSMMLRWFVLVIFLGCLLYYLSPIITPFFLGVLLAYLGNPMVTYCHHKKIPRSLGVLAVFMVLTIFLIVPIIVLMPIAQEQLLIVIQKIPLFISWFQHKAVVWLSHHPASDDLFNVAMVKKKLAEHSQKIGNLVSLFMQTAAQSTYAIITFFANMLLVFVVAFYLMRDWPMILENIRRLLPSASRHSVCCVAEQANAIVSAFLRGQLLVMLCLAVIYSIGLWLIGLPIAFLVGVVSGLLAIVPYVGFIVGISFASLVMYIESHSFMQVMYVLGIYMIGQIAESTFLTPCLVGDKIGLHPVAVIFSVLVGGYLFGFLGVLLALPVAAVVCVIIKNILSHESVCS
ncbi:MAG: AI-2E family transporter [Gammaproteobacteria bacterium]|nr:AI-2E family transporter [Gammaproteobacteria bacterium]